MVLFNGISAANDPSNNEIGRKDKKLQGILRAISFYLFSTDDSTHLINIRQTKGKMRMLSN